MSPSSETTSTVAATAPNRAGGSTLALPERLDRDAARDLHAELLHRRGVDLTLDGSAVKTTGALAVQVLVAAARDWVATSKTLTLIVSPAMREDLARLGVSNEFCLQGGT